MILIENHQDKTDKEAVFVILFHNPVGNLKEMGRNFILTGSLETSRRHMENAFSPQKKVNAENPGYRKYFLSRIIHVDTMSLCHVGSCILY